MLNPYRVVVDAMTASTTSISATSHPPALSSFLLTAPANRARRHEDTRLRVRELNHPLGKLVRSREKLEGVGFRDHHAPQRASPCRIKVSDLGSEQRGAFGRPTPSKGLGAPRSGFALMEERTPFVASLPCPWSCPHHAGP